uniref:DNA primase subunit 2 n=1 Tax=Callithrix jacchus TaxID=9483 RepID=A0A5F4WGA0_CALJA
MRQLHKALRENHHLRHGGRMQYGLFLKGIGLTLEQALQFWKQEFIKGKMDPDKFDKGYSYNIRHSFGKEGKRTDYTPFSCLKIILSNPPSHGDYHGCPFRHSDPELLKQKLQSYKISPGGISQILDLVKGTHYQVACQKYFEMIHNVSICIYIFFTLYPNSLSFVTVSHSGFLVAAVETTLAIFRRKGNCMVLGNIAFIEGPDN